MVNTVDCIASDLPCVGFTLNICNAYTRGLYITSVMQTYEEHVSAILLAGSLSARQLLIEV